MSDATRFDDDIRVLDDFVCEAAVEGETPARADGDRERERELRGLSTAE